jgi:hypothetical protein
VRRSAARPTDRPYSPARPPGHGRTRVRRAKWAKSSPPPRFGGGACVRARWAAQIVNTPAIHGGCVPQGPLGGTYRQHPTDPRGVSRLLFAPRPRPRLRIDTAREPQRPPPPAHRPTGPPAHRPTSAEPSPRVRASRSPVRTRPARWRRVAQSQLALWPALRPSVAPPRRSRHEQRLGPPRARRAGPPPWPGHRPAPQPGP